MSKPKNRLPEVISTDAEGHVLPSGKPADPRKTPWTNSSVNEDSPVKDMAAAPPPTVANLKAALASAAQQRAAACEMELRALLARYRCGLASVRLETNGVLGPMQVQVIAIPEE